MQITRVHGYQISYKTPSGERARFVNFSQVSFSELKFMKKNRCVILFGSEHLKPITDYDFVRVQYNTE